jgi:hypothetical protein
MMNPTQISIVLFGRDTHLLETRQLVLQTRGYRVLTSQNLAELDRIPRSPEIALIVLCHTLSAKERTEAVARASSRWPGIQKLALIGRDAKDPGEVVGQVRHALDSRLLSMVSELAGYAASSPCSHTY